MDGVLQSVVFVETFEESDCLFAYWSMAYCRYTEGNAYHHSYVPFAVKELSALHNNGKTSFSSSSGAGLRGFFGGGAAGSSDTPSSAFDDITNIGHSPNNNVLLQRLHDMLAMSGDFRPGSYGQEIHEM